MTDFDPEMVPIRAAATVLLIADRPELKILMMRRHAKTLFAGGMWVFPGGAVDPEDVMVPVSGQVELDYPGPITAQSPEDHRAYYVAAIRECFEEAGILLTLPDPSGSATAPLPLALQADLRDQLNAGTLSFNRLLSEYELIPNAALIKPVARWITPLGSPKRFDARFFLAKHPEDQDASHDQGELVDSEWLSPEEILSRFDAGSMAIMTPTLRMIQNLQAFNSADAVLAAMDQTEDYHQVLVDPDTGALLLPGERGYDAAVDHIETGWVRLRALRN
ncbi:MAG: NUDIX hydrolase [Pseudomonadales bacterium]|nr:NUDIX hydrolase [Pseudomonadales bacterium]